MNFSPPKHDIGLYVKLNFGRYVHFLQTRDDPRVSHTVPVAFYAICTFGYTVTSRRVMTLPPPNSPGLVINCWGLRVGLSLSSQCCSSASAKITQTYVWPFFSFFNLNLITLIEGAIKRLLRRLLNLFKHLRTLMTVARVDFSFLEYPKCIRQASVHALDTS